jgi:hypothetical protein
MTISGGDEVSTMRLERRVTLQLATLKEVVKDDKVVETLMAYDIIFGTSKPRSDVKVETRGSPDHYERTTRYK